MRIYIIGNDGITLCREPPATVNKGEVAVAPIVITNKRKLLNRLSLSNIASVWVNLCEFARID